LPSVSTILLLVFGNVLTVFYCLFLILPYASHKLYIIIKTNFIQIVDLI